MESHEERVLLILTLIIGALVGLVIAAFIYVTENLAARMYPTGGGSWRVLVIPTAGALLTGYLLSRYFPNARGSGIPQTKAALFLRDGFITFRTVFGKFSCSSVSLASGIALGREGPSVHIGAGLASVLGRRVGLSPKRVRDLIPVGAAAALAAAFNTPVAAVLFTLEEVMGDLHAPVLGSIVLSSATAWIVLHLLLGDEPLFHVPSYQLVSPIEFLSYAVLGVVGGLVSVCFVKLLLFIRKRFLALPRNSQWIQPAAGGLVVAVMAWFVPDVLGVGYGHVSEALNGQIPSLCNRRAGDLAASSGKARMAGSDAHTMASLGRTYTHVRGARSKQDFLAGLRAGRATLHGESGSYWKLTAAVLELGCRMMREQRWTLMLAPLALIVPLVTLANYVRELAFVCQWGSRTCVPAQPAPTRIRAWATSQQSTETGL